MAIKTHTVTIDGASIRDWQSFHDVFAQAFGFFEGYGRNMNAWIDCMSDLHEETGMMNITLPNDTALVLEITRMELIRKADSEIVEALVDCVAFVNRRFKCAAEEIAPIYLVLYS